MFKFVSNGKTKVDRGDEDSEGKKKDFCKDTVLPRLTKVAELHEDQDVETSNETTRVKKKLLQDLEELDMSSKNNDHLPYIGPEVTPILQKFMVILKDIINGVPTALNDLIHLLDNSHNTLDSFYKKLPDFIKIIITKLPDKLKGHLATDLSEAAAKAPGLTKGSRMGIKEIIAQPGIIYALLGKIINVLKLRLPAFIGANSLMLLSFFILLLVLWYCHKRGREGRLLQEAK